MIDSILLSNIPRANEVPKPKGRLANWLREQIRRSLSDAEEYAQDRDNDQAAEKCIGRADAFAEVLRFLEEQQGAARRQPGGLD